jgi:hypothetical protein
MDIALLPLTESAHTLQQPTRVQSEGLGDALQPFERRDRPVVLDVIEVSDGDLGALRDDGEGKASFVPQAADPVAERLGGDDRKVLPTCDMSLTLRLQLISCQRMAGLAPPEDDLGFPARLARWLLDRDHERTLLALANLRYEVVPLDEVVRLLLDAPAVKTLKLSWELWEAMLEKGEEDTEELLLRHVPTHALETARLALWGEDPHPSPHARLRIIHLNPDVSGRGPRT